MRLVRNFDFIFFFVCMVRVFLSFFPTKAEQPHTSGVFSGKFYIRSVKRI